mmetsp:Transcript_9138/g.18119  ORF Transcript_9138/g.18119 Transcript_9138/m.18119 type:complete len:214 (+) Transcript_9138:2013-2654(+)
MNQSAGTPPMPQSPTPWHWPQSDYTLVQMAPPHTNQSGTVTPKPVALLPREIPCSLESIVQHYQDFQTLVLNSNHHETAPMHPQLAQHHLSAPSHPPRSHQTDLLLQIQNINPHEHRSTWQQGPSLPVSHHSAAPTKPGLATLLHPNTDDTLQTPVSVMNTALKASPHPLKTIISSLAPNLLADVQQDPSQWCSIVQYLMPHAPKIPLAHPTT